MGLRLKKTSTYRMANLPTYHSRKKTHMQVTLQGPMDKSIPENIRRLVASPAEVKTFVYLCPNPDFTDSKKITENKSTRNT